MTVTPPEQAAQAAISAAAAASAVWVDQAATGAALIAERATAAATALLQQYGGWYGPREIETMSTELAQLSLDAQTAVAGLMSEYVTQTVATLTGTAVRHPSLVVPTIRNGVPLDVVHQRPMKAYRIEFAKTGSPAAAFDAAAAREQDLLQADIMLAIRESERDAMLEVGIAHYRRVLRPERSKSGSCLLCVAASLNVYTTDQLLPIHDGCQCLTLPIVDGQDPGHELNEEDRRQAYAEAGTADRDDLRRLRVKVQEHGELGPVLTVGGQHFTGPDDLPKKSKPRSPDAPGEIDPRVRGEQQRRVDDLLAGIDAAMSRPAAGSSAAGGAGSGQGGGPTSSSRAAAGDEPDPLEPLALGDAVPASVTTAHPLTQPPPTFEKIQPYIAAGDPNEHFDASEARTVARLRAVQPRLSLLSVAELDKVLSKAERDRRGPDAVLAGTRRTVEIKGIDAREGETHPSAIKRQLRKARTQARVAVVDGAEQGLTRNDAIAGLRGAVGTYGNDFDLIVILLGDGSAVHWRHA